MKSKLFYTFIMVLFGLFFTQAQTRSTVETKVILIVHKDSNQITNIELFNTQITEKEMLKKYSKSIFFLGLFKGRYELNNNEILPKSESIITMYTDKQLFSNSQFSPNKNMKIGNIKTKEISRKKGELIIKIN
jgi:hypothetical protein